MIDSIDKLIRLETRRAISQILESKLSNGSGDEDQERRRQDSQSKAISSRGLNASDDPSKKDEAEDDTDDKSADKKEKSSDEKKREDRTKGRGTADSPKLKDPGKKQLENPTVKSVVDKLNALRGGRSLKDPEVKKSFEQYYNGLTTPERQSLVVFLTGIAQVLAGAEEGTEAIDPGDVGLRVKDTDRPQKRTDTESKSKEGTEDNPIIVGEVASKHNIMRALREYSKYSK